MRQIPIDRRRRVEPEDQLTCQLKVYTTRSEQTAVDTLAVDGLYQGRSDVIRHAIALLIRTKHSDLGRYLRKDLLTGD